MTASDFLNKLVINAFNNFKGCGVEDTTLVYDTVTQLTIASDAKYAVIQVEADDVNNVNDYTRLVRFREDGGAPSSTVGISRGHLDIVDVSDTENLEKFKIINLSNAGTVKIHVLYYK